MKLVQLLTALPHYQLLTASISALEQVEISNFTADSRQVKPGTFFVAYQGVASDGHRFIPEVIAKGAAAIIGESEKSLLAIREEETQAPPLILVPNGREALAYLAAAWYGFPSRRLTMVGITGWYYAAAAIALGLWFLSTGLACWRTHEKPEARRLFITSVLYLPLLLTAMMLDRI